MCESECVCIYVTLSALDGNSLVIGCKCVRGPTTGDSSPVFFELFCLLDAFII